MWTAAVHLTLDINRTETSSISALYNILQKHSGSCPAFVHLQDPDKTDTVIALPDTLALKACASLTREVNGFLGYSAVETVCSDAVY
jgi:DNA polymerase-3 subunit alpha